MRLDVIITANPYELVSITMLSTGLALMVLLILYYLLKSRQSRITAVYLSGEPESVVSSITPSIASLYWGFMKKFAKSLYELLVGKVHTGSIHDWFKFLSYWFSILLIAAAVAFLFVLLGR